MRLTTYRAACIGILFLLAAHAVTALEVLSPKSTLPGDAISILVSDAPQLSGARVTLYSAGGTYVASARAFPYAAAQNVQVWVALLGIPSTSAPGSYLLKTVISAGNGDIERDTPIDIGTRSFRHESIHLDASLTSLQTEDNAIKTQQAEQLWHILTSFDPNVVLQTGLFALPVENPIVTSPYGEQRLFTFAGGGSQPDVHQGIDLAVPEGTPIHAAGAGKVVYAGSWLMTGNSVVIEHLPGVYSLYYHMERILVAVGQTVSKGQEIGLVGATGLATGPHLHWQIEVSGVAVDPLSLVRAGLLDPSQIVSETARWQPQQLTR